jgi:hypothetical protein
MIFHPLLLPGTATMWPGLLARRPNAVPALAAVLDGSPAGPRPASCPVDGPSGPGYVGKRRADRPDRRPSTGGRHRAGSAQHTDNPGHLLTPAARHLVAPTGDDERLPGGPDDATALHDLSAINTIRGGVW